MNKLITLCSVIFAVLVLAACKKTPDYVAVPYDCACGALKWQGMDYALLDANVIQSDSDLFESRRYYITANVELEGEVGTHGLNTWIEIPDLDGGGTFQINQQNNLDELTAWVDEFNLNDPIDTLRQYVAVEAVVQVQEAPITGGTENVNFFLTLNEVIDGVTIPGDVTYSGSFTVNVVY
jgi:hypothetical protein